MKVIFKYESDGMEIESKTEFANKKTPKELNEILLFRKRVLEEVLETPVVSIGYKIEQEEAIISVTHD